jgi:Tol biopolymer transport system component
MTAKVDRDSAGAIAGLSNFVVLGDFSSLGQASPSIDYSSDGGSILLSISSDLYRVNLSDVNTMNGAAEPLTPNTADFAEWNPSYSPDGSRVAYTVGPIGRTGGVSGQAMEISVLNLTTRASTPLTTKRNKGQAASGLDNAMWSATGASIGFSAYTGNAPRNSFCSALLNSEIFVIKADGSGIASALTATNGTRVEGWPQWGW